MQNKFVLWGVVLLVLLSGGWYLVGGGDGVTISRGETVARVNGEIITRSELNELKARFFGETPEGLDEAGNKQQDLEMLDSLINDLLLRQMAKQAGISVTDEDVRKEAERITSSFGGQEAFDDFLSGQGLTRASFEKQLKNDLLIQKYFEQRAGENAFTGPEELREGANIEILI